MPALSLLTMCDTVAASPPPSLSVIYYGSCFAFDSHSGPYSDTARPARPHQQPAWPWHSITVIVKISFGLQFRHQHPVLTCLDRRHIFWKNIEVDLSDFLYFSWSDGVNCQNIYLFKKISKFPLIPLILPTSSSKVKGILFTPKPGVSEYFIKQFLLSHAVRPLKLL